MIGGSGINFIRVIDHQLIIQDPFSLHVDHSCQIIIEEWSHNPNSVKPTRETMRATLFADFQNLPI